MSISPRRIGKYELQEQLGHGGMAEVWKAYDVQLHRHVAIKLLHANLQEDPNFVARFEREAQLIASLHHPNIVQVHDFQVASSEAEGPTAYMVMDYIEGQTLAHYIDSTSRQGHIPYPEQIVQLFTSIALAVDYAHSKSMIHRDLKPANILLDKRNTTNNPIGEPILTDFGLAKLLGTSPGTLTSTQPGTPLYISPEQVSGYGGNERSDIYALGIILYEMVTGTVPFQGDDPTAVMTQHLKATPPSPRQLNPNIPPALEVVIQRCLSKDPAARFPNASSLAAAIAEGLNVAVPERLGKPAYPADVIDMPTYFTPSPSNLLAHMTPSSPSLPVVKTSTPPSATLPYPQAAVSANSRQDTPLTPLDRGSGTPTPTYASQRSTPLTPSLSGTTPAGVLSPTSPVAPPAQPSSTPATPAFGPRPPRRRRGLILALLALILLIIGVSLATFFLFLLPANRPPVVTNPIVGHAFYVSSGQLNDGAQGIADELQVDLQHVSPPPAGKSYYLWLLADKDTTAVPDLLVPPPIHPPLLLTNNLPVQNSSVHYTYTGDAQHNNLLSETSRLLITLEDAGRTPVSPSTDPTTWTYYAQLPQAYIPADSSGLHLRGLDHIRHLYYNENHLKVLALYGGLDIWIFRNTEKILEWSTAARDDFDGTTGNYALMHDLFISILDYLDGVSNVHVDVPPGTPVRANANYAKVALLTVDTTKQGVAQFLDTDPPGDLDHLTLHLSELVKAPDASPQLRHLGQQVLVAIANAQGWLKQVRADAKQLFDMTPEQLAQPAAQNLLEDLVAQATYAYIGQLDPATNNIKLGITQAHYDVQKLATFDITTQVPKNL
jgi:eukaryotic-like serine/threonine-protein kinase